MMTIDCLTFNKNLPYFHNFVRLVGTHQSYYFILCNTLLLCFFLVFDSLLISFANLLVGLVYVPFIMYLINRFMEEKKETLHKSWVATSMFVATCIALAVYFQVQKMTAYNRTQHERKFPLFTPYD